MSKKADKVQSKLINTKESATYLSKIYKMQVQVEGGSLYIKNNFESNRGLKFSCNKV